MDAEIMDYVDSNMEVEVWMACPSCGERRVDCLVWDEAGEIVTCSTCGESYSPGD